MAPTCVALVAAKRPDDRLLQTIRHGVPGSIMPPSTASDAELHAIFGYIKALGVSAARVGRVRRAQLQTPMRSR